LAVSCLPLKLFVKQNKLALISTLSRYNAINGRAGHADQQLTKLRLNEVIPSCIESDSSSPNRSP
jgi:hypothetical protein